MFARGTFLCSICVTLTIMGVLLKFTFETTAGNRRKAFGSAPVKVLWDLSGCGGEVAKEGVHHHGPCQLECSSLKQVCSRSLGFLLLWETYREVLRNIMFPHKCFFLGFLGHMDNDWSLLEFWESSSKRNSYCHYEVLTPWETSAEFEAFWVW